MLNKIKAKKSKNKEKTLAKSGKGDLEDKNEAAKSLMSKLMGHKPMPQFMIYSRLDKNLLKLMLIKATQF